MKSSCSVLHLSRTPLVGAPAKISTALNREAEGYDSACVVLQDYPKPIQGLFLEGAILYRPTGPIQELTEQLVREADVIHVHNELTPEVQPLVLRLARPDCRFVYHVHSPKREGPLFFDRSDVLGFPWSAKVSIPHYPQRFFQDYRLVPNIVLSRGSVRPITDAERVRVLFSPAHRRTGLRWGDKVSPALEDALRVARVAAPVDVLDVKGMPPATLLSLRRTTHITIDEIVTGAFHQVSLEGLATGNVVVTAADWIARASLRMAIDAPDDPPFVHMEEASVGAQLLDLVRDRDRIRALQQASFDYYQTYLRPERLIRRFTSLYREVRDAPRP